MIAKRILIWSVLVFMGFEAGLISGRRSGRAHPAGPDGRLLPHYINSSLARSIKPGSPLSQVLFQLGDPIGEAGGWLLFPGSPPSGGYIRVKVDRSSGLVEAVDPGAG